MGAASRCHYPTSRSPLQTVPFTELPLGSVEPRGWLRDQLQLQAWGITGHLHDIWPDVGPTNGWLGGPGDDWERGPYYVDGLVPLAYLLQDERLIALASRFVEWSLASQRPDGFFGPATNSDWWSRMPMLKALVQYHGATGDDRVVDCMSHYLRYQHAHLAERPLAQWAAARGGENVLCAHWLHSRTGESFLLEFAETLHAQTIDWTGIFHAFPFGERQTAFDHRIHVVNVAMALKEPGVFWVQSGDPRHRTAPAAGLASLLRHHGLANGLFSGDEWLAGPDPTQGTETCAVVELMYSLEVLGRTLGDVTWCDRLEKVAYNALPACQTPDLWGHQYDQQPNQVLCSRARRNWTANDDSSNLFGLAPNFGCCTANLHQGWPKLAASLWAATPDGGLAAIAYAPASVSARVGSGGVARIDEATDYPFSGTIRLTVRLPAPDQFSIVLRVPEWAGGATVELDGQVTSPPAGSWVRLDRVWRDDDAIVLRLPLVPRLVDRPRGAVAVECGPLVFALPVGEAWRKVGGAEPCPDWEVHPTTPWNYGLLVNPSDPAASLRLETGRPGTGRPETRQAEGAASTESPAIARQPFDSIAPPLRLVGRGKRIPAWELADNSAGPLPESPVAVAGPLEDVELVPYGSARLRVTELPVVRHDD